MTLYETLSLALLAQSLGEQTLVLARIDEVDVSFQNHSPQGLSDTFLQSGAGGVLSLRH